MRFLAKQFLSFQWPGRGDSVKNSSVSVFKLLSAVREEN